MNKQKLQTKKSINEPVEKSNQKPIKTQLKKSYAFANFVDNCWGNFFHVLGWEYDYVPKNNTIVLSKFILKFPFRRIIVLVTDKINEKSRRQCKDIILASDYNGEFVLVESTYQCKQDCDDNQLNICSNDVAFIGAFGATHWDYSWLNEDDKDKKMINYNRNVDYVEPTICCFLVYDCEFCNTKYSLCHYNEGWGCRSCGKGCGTKDILHSYVGKNDIDTMWNDTTSSALLNNKSNSTEKQKYTVKKIIKDTINTDDAIAINDNANMNNTQIIETTNYGEPWTEKENIQMKELYINHNKSIVQIAKIHKRTFDGIRAQLKKTYLLKKDDIDNKSFAVTIRCSPTQIINGKKWDEYTHIEQLVMFEETYNMCTNIRYDIRLKDSISMKTKESLLPQMYYCALYKTSKNGINFYKEYMNNIYSCEKTVNVVEIINDEQWTQYKFDNKIENIKIEPPKKPIKKEQNISNSYNENDNNKTIKCANNNVKKSLIDSNTMPQSMKNKLAIENTYLHECAKKLMCEWLEIGGFDDLSIECTSKWDGDGIMMNYPLVKEALQEDFSNAVAFNYHMGDDRSGYYSDIPHPSYNQCVKIGDTPLIMLDIVFVYKGAILFGFQIYHKNPMSENTCNKIKKYFGNSTDFAIYEIDAMWILDRTEKPTNIFTKHCKKIL